jgi:hypothetical protein
MDDNMMEFNVRIDPGATPSSLHQETGEVPGVHHGHGSPNIQSYHGHHGHKTCPGHWKHDPGMEGAKMQASGQPHLAQLKDALDGSLCQDA